MATEMTEQEHQVWLAQQQELEGLTQQLEVKQRLENQRAQIEALRGQLEPPPPTNLGEKLLYVTKQLLQAQQAQQPKAGILRGQQPGVIRSQ